jgi:hypothetical protein
MQAPARVSSLVSHSSTPATPSGEEPKITFPENTPYFDIFAGETALRVEQITRGPNQVADTRNKV